MFVRKGPGNLEYGVSCFRKGSMGIESGVLLPLTAFFKDGEDELIGEGVQAIGDEDAEANIRQIVHCGGCGCERFSRPKAGMIDKALPYRAFSLLMRRSDHFLRFPVFSEPRISS